MTVATPVPPANYTSLTDAIDVLADDGRRDRPGVFAVGCPLEPPLLPAAQSVLTHQPHRTPASDGPSRHPATRASCAGWRRCRSTARTPNGHAPASPCGPVVAGWPGDPSQAQEPLWLTPSTWQRRCRGDIRLRLTDERKPHRRPARAKQAVARFSIPLHSVALLPKDLVLPAKPLQLGSHNLQPYLPAALCQASPPADHDCR